MGAGVANALQFRHLVPFVQAFSLGRVVLISFHRSSIHRSSRREEAHLFPWDQSLVTSAATRSRKQKRLEWACRGAGAHPELQDERYIVVVSKPKTTAPT